MTHEKEEEYRNNKFCRFCGRSIESDKGRDHCYSTNKYRGPAHSKCIIIVIQHRSSSVPFVFQNLSNYDCHLFF